MSHTFQTNSLESALAYHFNDHRTADIDDRFRGFDRAIAEASQPDQLWEVPQGLRVPVLLVGPPPMHPSGVRHTSLSLVEAGQPTYFASQEQTTDGRTIRRIGLLADTVVANQDVSKVHAEPAVPPTFTYVKHLVLGEHSTSPEGEQHTSDVEEPTYRLLALSGLIDAYGFGGILRKFWQLRRREPSIVSREWAPETQYAEYLGRFAVAFTEAEVFCEGEAEQLAKIQEELQQPLAKTLS